MQHGKVPQREAHQKQLATCRGNHANTNGASARDLATSRLKIQHPAQGLCPRAAARQALQQPRLLTNWRLAYMRGCVISSIVQCQLNSWPMRTSKRPVKAISHGQLRRSKRAPHLIAPARVNP